MNTVYFVGFLCVFLCVFTRSSSQRGFILTAPKILDAGSTEYFALSIFGVPNGGTVSVKLQRLYTDDVIAETKVFAQNDYNKWVRMHIPDIEDESAILHVQGHFDVAGGYEIDRSKYIRLRRKSVIVFIQTDKPVYKPGQTVKFRILPLDNQLVPLSGSSVGEVWIEDPSGIRVAQWKQVDLSNGIVQLELPLSDEPVFGIWKVRANVRNASQSQTFQVKEYVLPKFDVEIISPSVVLANAGEILLKICAKYTYGKSVDGMLDLKVNCESSGEKGEGLPVVKHNASISGCTAYTVKTKDLSFDDPNRTFRSLKIVADVLENNTEIVQNASKIVEISHTLLKIKFLGADEGSHYFKPGLPYHGTVQVLKPNKKAAIGQLVEICAERTSKVKTQLLPNLCIIHVTNKEGLISFTLPPQEPSKIKIRLVANAIFDEEEVFGALEDKIRPSTASITLKAWHSRSQSYLQIEPLATEVQCDKLESVKVLYTDHQTSNVKVYHQVYSRGRIVQLGSHIRSLLDETTDNKNDDDYLVLKAPGFVRRLYGPLAQIQDNDANDESSSNETGSHYGEFMISFDARATLSPVARILVFYVREDGEVVADSRKFRITHCLRNKVKLLFRHAQQYPDTEAAMLLSASPLSLCGVGLVDKSVHLLNYEQKFSKEKVFELMESFDVGKNELPRQVSRWNCGKSFTPWDNFDELRRRRRYVYLPRDEDYVDAMTAYEEAGTVIITDLTVETAPCDNPFHFDPNMPPGFPVYERRRGGAPARNSMPSIRGPPAVLRAPSYLTAMDGPEPEKQQKLKTDEENVKKSKSSLEIRNYFPETWLWELHEIGTSGEIALKSQLPHTITKWMGNAVCVHHKNGLGISDVAEIVSYQPFFVSFSLPYSVIRGEEMFVVVSVFNYLSECLPIKLSLEPSEFFKVLDVSGNHKLCVCGSKSNSHRFLIKPLVIGQMNITVYAYSLEDDIVCGNEVTARLRARDAVTRQLLVEAEGFPREETISTYFCPQKANGSYAEEFDLLLPEDVVEGSARAYVSVTGDLMGPALSGIEKLVRLPVGCGEQNMVLFTPNIYILDYLSSTGRVNEEIKSKALDYMKKGYQRELRYRHEDGSYSAFGKSDNEGSTWLTAFVVKSFAGARRFISLDDRDLGISVQWIVEKQLENGCFQAVGDLLNKALQGGLKDGHESLAPLSAYVLISLLESGYRNPAIVDNALFCLKASAEPGTYSLALFAYAAALANNSVAHDYLKQLEERAISNGHVTYWNYDSGKNIAISVEIAGYVILAMMELGEPSYLAKALPIVKWIAQKRNANGGFISTQDTVVALQALAKYASHGAGEKVNIGIAVEGDEFVHGFKIDNTNKLVMQTVKVPVVPTVVDLQAAGEGCALTQFTIKYNVETPTGNEAFDLNVTGSIKGSSDCNSPSVGICMRYKIPGEVSNMAVVEVKMPSGYVVDEWNLHKLKENPALRLKRHEVIGNVVNFYFMKLTNEQKCFHFPVKNDVEITNVKDSPVRLYDYYQPELEVTARYSIPSICTVQNLPDIPPISMPYEKTSVEPEDTTEMLYSLGTSQPLQRKINSESPENILSGIEESVQESTLSGSESTPTLGSTLEGSILSGISAENVTLGTEGAPTPKSSLQENSFLGISQIENATSENFLGTEMPTPTEESSHASFEIFSTVLHTEFSTVTEIDSESEMSAVPIATNLLATATDTLHTETLLDSVVPEEDRPLSDGTEHDVQQEHSNIFKRFVEFNEPMDFPEGIEENQPVSVAPPEDFAGHFTIPGNDLNGCPTCLTEFPENFTDIYCSSAFALRVSIRDVQNATVKILYDVSVQYTQPRTVKEFGALLYNKTCTCPQIARTGIVFIFGQSRSSWTVFGAKHEIKLTDSSFVISTSSKALRPREMKQAINRCTL